MRDQEYLSSLRSAKNISKLIFSDYSVVINNPKTFYSIRIIRINSLKMNKIAIFLIVGFVALASGCFAGEVSKLTIIQPRPYFNISDMPIGSPLLMNITRSDSKPSPKPTNISQKTLMNLRHFQHAVKKSCNRSNLLRQCKDSSKDNTSKVMERILPTNATEALELFVKNVVSKSSNHTQVSVILQLVGELLLADSQCAQDLGGAFYVASVVVADIEAGQINWEQDIIATILSGVLVKKATEDCPAVVQILEELLRIL